MSAEPDPSNPAEHIAWLFEQRTDWSDDAIMEELKALPVLPDEETLMAGELEDWNVVDLFLALADQAAARRLRPALPLLLERASYGDPGETMRGLRHSLEKIVAPDWDALLQVCMEAARYPQRGARLWAVDELGILRDERARPILLDALNDPEALVCEAAELSLKMLDQAQQSRS